MDSKIEPVAWLTVAANMRAALISMQVGGCTCDTKSPALEFHDIRCRYRQAAELDGVLETLTDEVVAALLAAEQRGRESERERLLPGNTRETIEQMVKGAAPMSRFIGSVDCKSYDDLVPWLEGQLRDKLNLKAAIDVNGDDDDIREFVNGGAFAIECLLMTLRNVAAAIRKGE